MKVHGLCSCGHVRLAHNKSGHVGSCEHTGCLRLRKQGGGCQAFEPATLTILPNPLFVKGKKSGHEYIECGICQLKSFNLHDIVNEYCGNCNVFLNDLTINNNGD